jgi:hypothetical protein
MWTCRKKIFGRCEEMDKLEILMTLKQELARVQGMLRKSTGDAYLLGEMKGLKTAIVLLQKGGQTE